ncbi:MAG: hypothetical protein IPG79_18695 [Saprospiraceae bacterium]|nr:hypothetical protein [Saprospiraceae bacterium]
MDDVRAIIDYISTIPAFMRLSLNLDLSNIVVSGLVNLSKSTERPSSSRFLQKA